MDKDMIAATLRDAGFQVQSSARMGDGDGWRITLVNGAVLHCFDDGRCIVHGSGAARLRSLLRANGATSQTPGAATKRQIGGHDGQAHDRSRR